MANPPEVKPTVQEQKPLYQPDRSSKLTVVGDSTLVSGSALGIDSNLAQSRFTGFSVEADSRITDKMSSMKGIEMIGQVESN